MAYPNIFDREVSDGVIARLSTLTPEAQWLWVSFGVLTKTQYSDVLYKHIDHHLPQFGA